MNKRRLFVAFAITVGPLLLAAFTPQHLPPISEYPAPSIREERTLIVDGGVEVWQLKWKTSPKQICEPSDVSLTCPCTGFAYGEGGDLELIRIRNGVVFDLLPITPFFRMLFSDEGRMAIIQHWRPDYKIDFDASFREDFPAVVARRPTVPVMNLADYDHDGNPNEFYLQTEAIPCGKSLGVVVGISKGNPRLHAFGTASNPEKPLYMLQTAWEALRNASGPIEVREMACGDHGAQTETTLRLRWAPTGIDGRRREFDCGPDLKRGQLIHEDPLQ